MQVSAIERATELLLTIVGGKPGPIVEQATTERLPKPGPVYLRHDRIARVLGVTIAEDEVESILSRLGMRIEKAKVVG